MISMNGIIKQWLGSQCIPFNHMLERFQASRRRHIIACWYLYRRTWRIAQVPKKTGSIVLAIHKNLVMVWLHL